MARLLVGTKSRMLPLPGGTFNHFVKDLGVSPNINNSLKNISSASEQLVDVAYVNDELFLNNSSLGLYPFSLTEQKKVKNMIGKWPAALVSAVKQLSCFRRHSLIIDGKSMKSSFVFVDNGFYDIQSSLLRLRTNLSGSTLTIIVSSSRTRVEPIKSLLAVLRGNVLKRSDLSVTHGQSLVMHSRRAYVPVSLDGEVKRLVTPLNYTVKPKSLSVLLVKAA